jgi:hypothetical protein
MAGAADQSNSALFSSPSIADWSTADWSAAPIGWTLIVTL